MSQPSKVADCFKYRNKVGIDVAMEAARDYFWNKAGTMDELWAAMKFTRMTKVMMPYVEMIAVQSRW